METIDFADAIAIGIALILEGSLVLLPFIVF